MNHMLTRILFYFRESQIKRKNAYFGTSLYEKLLPNPLPHWILIGVCGFVIFYLSINIHYLSDFLFWFVGILEITKVLKIPFLDHIKYYQYLGMFVFFYLTFSLLWDLSSLLSKWSTKIYVIRDEIWKIENYGLGAKLTKFSYSPEEIQVVWIHSGILDYFGLNQISWKKGDQVLATSPFFFPYRKNKVLLNKILKR